MERTCTRCGEVKPLTDFSPNKRMSLGVMSRCKKCCAELANARYHANVERAREIHKAYYDRTAEERRKHAREKYAERGSQWWTDNRVRENYYQRLYGISIADYERMFEEQQGRCAICQRHQDEFPRRLSVDHCHKEGHVRALLCGRCNAYLGFFEMYEERIRAVLGR